MTLLVIIGQFLLRHRLWVIVAGTLVLGTALVPGFFSLRTLVFSLDRGSTIGIVAVGMTVVLIAGRIDLSCGSILAFCGILLIELQPIVGSWPAVVIAVAAGALAGLLNAALVVITRIDSMIATLATMLAIRSLAHLVTNSLPVTGLDREFGAAVTGGSVGIFSNRVLLFFGMIALLQVWLTHTPFGRNLYAVGSSTVAARESGINATRYVVGAFAFAGLCAGLAGALLSLNVNIGSPVFGFTVLLSAVMAVVMGGTRLEGGRGSAIGTLGGVVTVGALTTALEYASVPAHIQQIVTGSILILLIVMDRVVPATRMPGLSFPTGEGRAAREVLNQVNVATGSGSRIPGSLNKQRKETP